MKDKIKNLSDALAHIEAQDKTIADLTTARDNEKTRADKAEGDLKAANDLLAESQTDKTKAEKDRDGWKAKAEAAESDQKRFASISTALEEAGFKVEAKEDAEFGKALAAAASKRASAEAMQICAAQGVDAPLPTGASGQSGAAHQGGKEPKTAAEHWAAKMKD